MILTAAGSAAQLAPVRNTGAGSGLVQATAKQVYDTNGVQAAADKLARAGSEANRSLVSLYEQMLESGGVRYSVKPAGMPDLQPLYEEHPNFWPALDLIKRSLALCIDSEDPLEIPPMLLLGPPGVGKAHFGRSIAKLFGTGFHNIPMSSTTAGFVLGGASSQWKNSKPGKVLRAFVDDSYANPVFLIDEIDKAGGSADYDPLGALYGLLEQGTASEFVDEFAEVPIDATGAIWVATCNDLRPIPEPIVSRLRVFEIKPPTKEQCATIAMLIYKNIRESHAWGKRFPEAPVEEVLIAMAQTTPRLMRQQIFDAFGQAKVDGRRDLRIQDLAQATGVQRNPIGFTAN